MATACAWDRSPTSPLTTARSTLPDENASAASSALVFSTSESRTGAFFCASLLASAATTLLASPSNDPTAMVSVSGREYQRQPNRLAPATRTTIPATRVMRSHVGNFFGSMPDRLERDLGQNQKHSGAVRCKKRIARTGAEAVAR